MESAESSNYDFLKFSKDKYVTDKLLRDEPICFSDNIIKINKYGWHQKRNIIITDKALYNLKKKDLKRRIKLSVIRGVTLSKVTDEFIIHCNDDDYDYHYESQKKNILVQVLAKYYCLETKSELKLYLLNLVNLDGLVTTKKEKAKDKNKSRMPNGQHIVISEFIYGTENVQKAPRRQTKAVKTLNKSKTKDLPNASINDFDILKVIGRGSVGKILLVKYKKNGEFYALKNMRKDQLISEGIVGNILGEKNILNEIGSPFILTLSFLFQSPERLYIATPFIPGGDLYSLLRKRGPFPENEVRFYCAQVALALRSLHEYDIAYRDLKPENVLIDSDGYLKLCDFGAVANMQGVDKEYSFAGAVAYASPEMISGEGHGLMHDWWSFGILVYELFYGCTPFYSSDKTRMKELIDQAQLKFPQVITVDGQIRSVKISNDAVDLIKRLLVKEPKQRLGAGGFYQIKSHTFFSGINFDLLTSKRLKSPYKPTINNVDSTENFDDIYTNLDINDSPVSDWFKDYKNLSEFDNFNI